MGAGVGAGVGAAVCLGVGAGVGEGVGAGVAAGVGARVGAGVAVSSASSSASSSARSSAAACGVLPHVVRGSTQRQAQPLSAGAPSAHPACTGYYVPDETPMIHHRAVLVLAANVCQYLVPYTTVYKIRAPKNDCVVLNVKISDFL